MRRARGMGLAGCAAWMGWAALLAGCGTGAQEGGGGFGGETISGRVVGTSGSPVAGAAVRARTTRTLDAQPLADTRTDDSGMYSLEGLPSVPLRLEVAGLEGTKSVAALAEHDPGRSAGVVVAHPAGSRVVRIVDAAGNPLAATLQAYGLGAVASTDDAGVARLSGWPASDVWVRLTPRDGGPASDLFVPASDTSPLVVGAGWLVDDFEGATTKTRLGLLLGGGWWYAASAGAITDPDGANAGQEVFGGGYDSTQSHGGRASLRARFAFSPTNSNRYGLVGFHLGMVDGESVDLSGMDSLVLWLKGDGSVRVDLVVREGDQKRVYAKTVTPQTGWTRVSLSKTDFAPVDGGTLWPRSAERALYLQFSVYRDTEFWLDDLRLHAAKLP